VTRSLRTLLALTPLPLLGALGTFVLSLAHDADERADRARERCQRAMGARDEARREASAVRVALTSALDELTRSDERVVMLTREVETLRSELASAAADDELNSFTAQALDMVKDERDELRRRCDALTAQGATVARSMAELQSEVDDTRGKLHAAIARALTAEQEVQRLRDGGVSKLDVMVGDTFKVLTGSSAGGIAEVTNGPDRHGLYTIKCGAVRAYATLSDLLNPLSFKAVHAVEAPPMANETVMIGDMFAPVSGSRTGDVCEVTEIGHDDNYTLVGPSGRWWPDHHVLINPRYWRRVRAVEAPPELGVPGLDGRCAWCEKVADSCAKIGVDFAFYDICDPCYDDDAIHGEHIIARIKSREAS